MTERVENIKGDVRQFCDELAEIHGCGDYVIANALLVEAIRRMKESDNDNAAVFYRDAHECMGRLAEACAPAH